jgi:beta-glucanase (GH16 family)
VNTTIHKDGYAAYHQEITNATLVSNPNPPNWHIIGMEWGPTYCKFYTDGVLQYTMTNPAFISNRPEYIILSNQEGWGHAPNQYGSTYPTQTVYDYVRVYNKN